MLQNINLGHTESLSAIKNWLGRECLQLIVTLIQEEQEACYDERCLFETLNKNKRHITMKQ